MEVSGENDPTNPMNLLISHKTQKSPTPTSQPPKAPEGRWLDIPFAQSLAALLAAPAPNPPGKGPALASLGSRGDMIYMFFLICVFKHVCVYINGWNIG
jgi:hypothetical protein